MKYTDTLYDPITGKQETLIKHLSLSCVYSTLTLSLWPFLTATLLENILYITAILFTVLFAIYPIFTTGIPNIDSRNIHPCDKILKEKLESIHGHLPVQNNFVIRNLLTLIIVLLVPSIVESINFSSILLLGMPEKYVLVLEAYHSKTLENETFHALYTFFTYSLIYLCIFDLKRLFLKTNFYLEGLKTLKTL